MSQRPSSRPAHGDPSPVVEPHAPAAPEQKGPSAHRGAAVDARQAAAQEAPAKARPGNARAADDALAKGRDQQQQMLSFVETRLSHVSSVQLREIDQAQRRPERSWWYLVADQQKQDKGVTKPTPTEWHKVAAAYKDAAHAIARGDLARGGALLRHAFDEERKTFSQLSHLVHTNEAERPRENPWHQRVKGLAVGSVHVPKGISTLASAISDTFASVKDPPVRPESSEKPVEAIEAEKVDEKEAKKVEAPAEQRVAEKKPERAPEEDAREGVTPTPEADKQREAPRAEASPEGAIAQGAKVERPRQDRLASAAKRAAVAKQAAAQESAASAEAEVARQPLRAPTGAGAAELATVKPEEQPAEQARLADAARKAEEEKERSKPAIAQEASTESTKKPAAKA